MSTLDEINEDWQINGLSPTWAKLQRAKQEQAALIAERDALKEELKRIKALPPVAWRSSMGHGVTLKETITDEQKALTWAGKPMWQPLIALGSKTA